jgi:hypothetical protein
MQKPVLLGLVLLVTSASTIHAATKVSARDGGFGLGSTWADNVPPASGDDITVLPGHSVHGTGGAVVGDVIVRGTLVLSTPGLTVNGNLRVEGGTISALSGSISFKGSDCVNEGKISASTLFEGNDLQTISGEGSWTSNVGRFSGGPKRVDDIRASKGAWLVDAHVTLTNRWVMTDGRITKTAAGSIEGTELGRVEFNGVGEFAADETAGNLWRAQVAIESGTRAANGSSSLSAPVVVRNGATLATHLKVTLQLKDVVIISEGGKLAGEQIQLAGDKIVNLGEVSPVSLVFDRDGDQDIIGAGMWRRSNGIYFRGSGRKSLSTNMTTSVGSITVESHLDLNDHDLTISGGNFNKPASGAIDGTGRVVSTGVGNVYSIETAGNLWRAPLEIVSGTRAANTTSSFSAPITVRSGATLGSHLRVTIHARGSLTVEPGASIEGESLAVYDGDFVNNGAVTTTTSYFNGANRLSGTTGSFGGNGTYFQPGSAVRLDGTQQFGNLTVQPGGALDISNQTIRVSRGLAAGGPSRGRLTTAGSTIELNGTSAEQALTTTIEYHNLTINNSRGVGLAVPSTVGNILRLERTVFNIGSNRLTIGSCGQIVYAGGTLNGTPVGLNCS